MSRNQSDTSVAAATADRPTRRDNWWDSTDHDNPADVDAPTPAEREARRTAHARSDDETASTEELVKLVDRWLRAHTDLDAEAIEARVEHARRLKKNSHENNLDDVEILAVVGKNARSEG